MPRIITGTAKNKKLKIPDIEDTRVVTDKVKQALFSIIGDKIVDSTCLDLYAGSGSLGLEALSRGAKWCDFVDINPRAARTIEANAKTCEFLAKAEIINTNALKYAANTQNKYDIIFADPFYENTKHKFLFKNLEEILKPAGTIAFMHDKKLDLEKQIEQTNLEIKTQRKFGVAALSILSLA